MQSTYTESLNRARRSLWWYAVLAGLYLKLLAWETVTKGLLGIVYFVLIAEGIRQVLPTLGIKLSKIPGLGLLSEYEGIHKLDLAHLLSIIILIFAWIQWRELLLVWLSPEPEQSAFGWRPRRHQEITVILAAVVLISDGLLFYSAMADLAWNGSWFSITAFIATVVYVAILVFVTFVSINMKRAIQNHWHKES